MTPTYVSTSPSRYPERGWGISADAANVVGRNVDASTPWEVHTEARSECFMAGPGVHPVTYTYGSGRGVRTYASIPLSRDVQRIWKLVVAWEYTTFGPYPDGACLNVCFLNRYADEHQHLGWHADDHPGTDHTHPIVVVSFGAPREIWWRKKGASGEVPPSNRQRLEEGSLFCMPPGFQADYQHRIPKGDRKLGPRISLTFRRFLPGAT